MKTIKALLFKFLFPAEAKELRSLEDVLDLAGHLVGHRVDNCAHLYNAVDDLFSQRHKLRVEHADCLETLMALVSINEDGNWSTVLDADTLLPPHMQEYLHQVVART